MRILHTVEHYTPFVCGMQEVVKQISERLVRLGHEVTVATQFLPYRSEFRINGVNIVQFDISGNAVRGYKFGDVEKYRQYLLNADFDIITNFAAQQWATDLMLPILDKVKARKVFVPTGFSALYDPRYQEYFREMKRWIHQYDMNVFLSEDYRDILFAKENGVSRITLIPNGASEEEFFLNGRNPAAVRAKLGIPADHFLIVNLGSHTGLKGHAEAIRIFLEARIKKSTLLIIGTEMEGGCARMCHLKEKLFRFAPLQHMLQGRRTFAKRVLTFRVIPESWLSEKQLLVRTLSRRDTIDCLHAADLFLFPSNIECSPIVLFESVASKTPFVVSNVGNSAEIAEWTHGGMMLPTSFDDHGFSKVDVPGSARILESLYNNAASRARMAAAGFEAWKRRFTWERIAGEYERLYFDLIGGRS